MNARHLQNSTAFRSSSLCEAGYGVWQEHHAIEQASPKNALRFLMESRGLKQEDLSSIVPQSNLSAILAGKRKISATLAGKFGKYFGGSAVVFCARMNFVCEKLAK